MNAAPVGDMLHGPIRPVAPSEADTAWATAQWLTGQLGDPDDPDNPFGDIRAARNDTGEHFPAAACGRLDALGITRFYVPEEHGGSLDRYDVLLYLMRVVAGRDLTVAIAHGKTFLGAVCVWVAGSPEQCRRIATRIGEGDAVALALTEQDNGSDLLAGDVTAIRQPHGWTLHGRKWLINNANRATVLTVLARSRPEGGPRGFAVLLADKRSMSAETYRCLPRIPTHGIRGADIAAIEFEGATVPHDAVVGRPDSGLDVVLKGLQLTRTLCGALSLGAADHALSIAARFAEQHTLYGRRLIDMAEAQRILVQAWVDLAIADAVSTVGARSIHSLAAELAITSAVVKSLVPTRIGETLTQLGKLLGARAFLEAGVPEAGFQKIERDHAIVGIFDGSTAVNLHALINQFPAVCSGYRAGKVDREGLATAARLDAALPPWQRDGLTLLSSRGSSLAQAIPELCAALTERSGTGMVTASLAARAQRLRAVADELHAAIAQHLPVRRRPSSAHFALARRYAACFAAAACTVLWLENPREGTPLWSDGEWLVACLDRLLPAAGHQPHQIGEHTIASVLPVLRGQVGAGGPLRTLPWTPVPGGDRT